MSPRAGCWPGCASRSSSSSTSEHPVGAMRTPIPCPEPNRLRGLIDESLPDGDQARLIGHLDVCPECQQQLEQLASGGEPWSEALTAVSRVPPPRDSAFWPALQQLEQEFAPAGQPLL